MPGLDWRREGYDRVQAFRLKRLAVELRLAARGREITFGKGEEWFSFPIEFQPDVTLTVEPLPGDALQPGMLRFECVIDHLFVGVIETGIRKSHSLCQSSECID